MLSSAAVRVMNKSTMLRSSPASLTSQTSRVPQQPLLLLLGRRAAVASIPGLLLSSSAARSIPTMTMTTTMQSSSFHSLSNSNMIRAASPRLGPSQFRASLFSTQTGAATTTTTTTTAQPPPTNTTNATTTTTTPTANANTTPTTEHPEIEVVYAENAPKAIGPFSQAIKAHNTLYVSGCLGLDPKTAEFPSDDVQEQARQAITNLKRILVAGDSSLARVVKVTVLLTDINDFAKVNAVYSEYFTGIKPARTTYAVVALPKNAKVEIEAIALVGKGANEQHAAEEQPSSSSPNKENTAN